MVDDMKPILFPEDATTYTTNGLGRIDCLSCIVREERNGEYELEAVVPEGGQHVDQIVMNSILVVTPADGVSLQAFRVYKVTKPINGKFTVYAQHISYQLSYIPAMPFSINASAQACAQTLAGLKSHAAEDCPFNFHTDVVTVSSYSQTQPASIRSRLAGVKGSVLDRFGGEYLFDNYDVYLKANRGLVVPAVSLRYGKNITDLKQEEYISNTITGVVPYWAPSDGSDVVTLPEMVVESQYADLYPFRRTVPLDLSQDFETQPTYEQIRNAARAYINKAGIGIPTVSIAVSFVALSQTEEYKDVAALQHVKLCDNVQVVFEKLGISTTAKVVKTTWNVLKEKYDSIEIGALHTSLASAISDTAGAIDVAEESVRYAIRKATAELIDDINNATAWLTSAGGYVIAIKNNDGTWKELCFASSTDLQATSTKVLRINENGIGFSSRGINGPYTQAWTLDGKMVIGGTNVPSLTVYENGGSSGNIIFKISKDGMRWNAANSSMTESGVLTILAGAIRLGLISAGNYNFAVENDGTLTIKKGSINLGYDSTNRRYRFSVDNNGNLAAYSGTFAGALAGATGTFTGAIQGGSIGIGGNNNNQFVVDGNGKVTIKKGSLNINGQFVVDEEGNVTIKKGSINIGNGQFFVDAQGTLTANAGRFSGQLKIGLIPGTTGYYFTVDNSGKATIKKGSLDINDGTFAVNDQGVVTIKSGSFMIGSKSAGDTWDRDTNFGVSANGSTYARDAYFMNAKSWYLMVGREHIYASLVVGVLASLNNHEAVRVQGCNFIVFDTNEGGNIKFQIDNSTGNTTIAGTLTDKSKIIVKRTSQDTRDIEIENGTVITNAVRFYYGSSQRPTWEGGENANTIHTDGQIDVGDSDRSGTSTFHNDVDIGGRLKMYNSIDAIDQTITAGNFVQSSDKRVKKNIKDIVTEKARDFIMKLKPKSFKYRKGEDRIHHGFIAQDVQEIAGEWGIVHEDDHLSLSYTEIIADLVAVVQDQERRIAALERRINAVNKS